VQEFANKKKTANPLKILGARRMTWTKFHTEDPQILGGSVQNLVAMATGRPRVCALVLATPGVWPKNSDHDVLKRWYKLLNRMQARVLCCTVGRHHCIPIKTPDLKSCTLIPQWWNWNSEFWLNCLNESECTS
jgi:hypothetical protein